MNIKRNKFNLGLSLIELLVVIVILSILTSIVMPSFSHSVRDSRAVVARQQHQAIQNALDKWIIEYITNNSVSQARNIYNQAPSPASISAGSPKDPSNDNYVNRNRFELIKKYLNESMQEGFSRAMETHDKIDASDPYRGELSSTKNLPYSIGGVYTSQIKSLDKMLVFPQWQANSTDGPTVLLVDIPAGTTKTDVIDFSRY